MTWVCFEHYLMTLELSFRVSRVCMLLSWLTTRSMCLIKFLILFSFILDGATLLMDEYIQVIHSPLLQLMVKLCKCLLEPLSGMCVESFVNLITGE